MGPSIQSCSGLRFITVKGHKAKSAKTKGAQGAVWRDPGASFRAPFSSAS